MGIQISTIAGGKAQQAYAALSPDDAKDYAILKKAILLYYDINEESY